MRYTDVGREKLILGGLLAILVAMLGGIALAETVLVEKTTSTFEANASVTSTNNTKVGLVTGSNLNLGKVPEGSQVRKDVEISTSEEVLVKMKSKGNISKMLQFGSPRIINSNTGIELTFDARKEGYYTGNVKTEIVKPKNRLGKGWIRLRERLGY